MSVFFKFRMQLHSAWYEDGGRGHRGSLVIQDAERMLEQEAQWVIRHLPWLHHDRVLMCCCEVS